jgi:hypothetical protein
MSHIKSIGAGLFSDLSVTNTSAALSAANLTYDSYTALKTLFANEADVAGVAGTFKRIENVREFPPMGTPPNIVNVPVYGSATSQQIQGQADAPSMEITMNYVAEDWASDAPLGAMVGDGQQRVFRFSLLNSEPDAYGCDDAGLGTVENSQYFWVGKIEALQVNPQLTDSNTATVTITVQSDFFGAFTESVAPTADSP